MFGLNERSRHYKRTGQQGGKPAYAAESTEFACRTQPTRSRSLSDEKSVMLSADTLVFAPGSAAALGISPGDRLEIGTEHFIVSEVQAMRGYAKIHHLEILAKKEGG